MKFPLQIIHNKYHHIDVDKWDYILRDIHYLRNALKLPNSFGRLFEGARVLVDIEQNTTHISYHEKDLHYAYELFQNRKQLHIECYQHPNVVLVEKM